MMRLVLTLGALCALASLARAADVCPNLSGEFVVQADGGPAEITIAQTACEQIRIERTTSSRGTISREQHTLKIDGKFQNDTSWRGGADRYQTSARFISAALEIIVRPSSASSDSDFSFRFLYVLRSNGDLDIREFDRNTNGYVPTTMAIRKQ